MSVALALDIGTTSIAALAVDHDGEIVSSVAADNSSVVPALPTGHTEQSPAEIRSIAIRVLRQLSEQIGGHTPHCLGLTGQMHGVVLLDSNRRPVSNLITWQDRRANEPAANSDQTILEQFLDRCDTSAIDQTGCRLAPGYMATTLFALQSRDEVPESANRAAFIVDWIAAELGNADDVTDRSNAAGAGVYDLKEDCWSDSLIQAGNLHQTLFPEVRESGEVIGKLSVEVAAETGLPSGLPICNAIGDNQAAVLGSVPAGDPAIQINIGTGGQINWPVNEFVRVDGMDTRYLPHNRFMLVGAGLAGGDAYAWLKNVVAGWTDELGVQVSSDQIYESMNRLAADQADENDGLVCEPLFRGTRRQPLARGSFQGITAENFTLGRVARSLLHGIANGLHWFYNNAGTMKPESIARIIGSGNGLRKNPLLVEIIGKTFERPVLLPHHQEEAAYGTALLAGSSTGLWPDLKTAGQMIRLQTAS